MSPSTDVRRSIPASEVVKISGAALQVSRVALGTWAMGGWMWGGADRRESIDTVHAALDQGINLIDTAPVYGFGVSEEIVGAATFGSRAQTLIATKTGVEWRGGQVYRNASRARILHEIDDSLRRLRTDYIDIYQVAWPDPLVPVEETAEAMNFLYRLGKIRAIGVSNFSLEQMERFRRVAPLHVLQAPYNLFERAIETDILPYCIKYNIVTLGYGALCRGLLSGRMRANTVFQGDDLRSIDPKFRSPRFAQYLNAVRRLDEFAQGQYHCGVIQLAVRWMLDQGVSVALWGARHPNQLDASTGVPGWSLSGAAREQIENILAATIRDPVGPEFMAPPQRPL